MSAGPDVVLGIGGPLAAAPADVLVREAFAAELTAQRGLAQAMSWADLAYVLALDERGVIPAADAAALLAALLELHAWPERLAFDPALGDVYTNREAWLSARTPAAGWLGAGRARRESTTTGFVLAVRAAVLDFARGLLDVGAALVDSAETHVRSVMPDYTYLQAAQPTSLGHYLLTFACGVARDLERAQGLFARFDRCPAGVGSTNGSTLGIDRARLAGLLGFADVAVHARDAMWQPDGPIEAAACACAAVVNLDRLAEDLAIFATAEFGFVTLGDALSRASKAMPQKKNPFALAYVRAVANRTIGIQAGLAAAGRTPSGQMDNRLAAYADVPDVLRAVTGAAALLAAALRGMTFDAAAARAALARSFVGASDLAELVMREAGVDYRRAHALVGRVVRAVAVGDLPALAAALDAEARAAWGTAPALDPAALRAALDPLAALERRDGPGGAAPARVAELVRALRTRFEADRAALAAAERRIGAAQSALLESANRRASAQALEAAV